MHMIYCSLGRYSSSSVPLGISIIQSIFINSENSSRSQSMGSKKGSTAVGPNTIYIAFIFPHIKFLETCNLKRRLLSFPIEATSDQ
jgi:hypothetical protein